MHYYYSAGYCPTRSTISKVLSLYFVAQVADITANFGKVALGCFTKIINTTTLSLPGNIKNTSTFHHTVNMHAVGIHSAMAIKRQRKRRDNQKRIRERRYSTQSSESGETIHSPNGSIRRKYNYTRRVAKPGSGMIDSQVVTSIGMLHIGIVFIVFGVFLCGAGVIPDENMSWSVFSSSAAWWNEVTCTGLFSLGLGLFLLILNCLISRKEEEDLEDYVQHQLTRSRSGHRLERDIETGVLTTRHARKNATLKNTEVRESTMDTTLEDCSLPNIHTNGTVGIRTGLNNDILLEKIDEEDMLYLNSSSVGVSAIEIDKDSKTLLREHSTYEALTITKL